MSIEVEVNLRLPNVSVRAPDEPARVISNIGSRFITVIQMPALPKLGDRLELSTRGGYAFEAVVKRVDWHDDKNRFVVACQFAKRSMRLEEYESVRADPEWTMRPLV